MTRVIAGLARGRRLAVPGGRTTRPTSDRAREAMFAAAGSILGSFAGTRVLDLYAGSGAFGLEALSRGAAAALLVEADPRSAQVIRANIGAIALPGARLVHDRVERLLARGLPATDEPYDVAFADPPYALGDDDVTAMLAALAAGGWLAPGALVIVERAARSGPLRWPEGFSAGRSRRYGEATLWYASAPARGQPGPGPAGAQPAGAELAHGDPDHGEPDHGAPSTTVPASPGAGR
jgi:16S rRNA (guanine966-N2)-methyltransferase